MKVANRVTFKRVEKAVRVSKDTGEQDAGRARRLLLPLERPAPMEIIAFGSLFHMAEIYT